MFVHSPNLLLTQLEDSSNQQKTTYNFFVVTFVSLLLYWSFNLAILSLTDEA